MLGSSHMHIAFSESRVTCSRKSRVVSSGSMTESEDMRTTWRWSSPEGRAFQRHILYVSSQ